MKQFLKFVLATITGFFILFGIFFIVFLSMINNLSKSDKKVEIDKNSVLTISLNYDLPDRSPNNPFEDFAADLAGEMGKTVGLYDVIKTIDAAREDKNVKGIFLDLTFVGAGYGKLSEVRAALEEFKTSGKFIYAYAEVLYNQTYYLASVADKIYLNPNGNIFFNGMSAEVLFIKETLAKLGIEMQAIKHGKFKGAVEPFTMDKLSDENRSQIDAYVQSVYQNFLVDISRTRNLSIDTLKAIVNNFSVSAPEQALAHKLVDQLAYRDEVMKAMAVKLKLEKDKEVSLVKLEKYFNSVNQVNEKIKDYIAVIYADGDIVSGNGQGQEIGSNKFAKALKDARTDKNVKAVVLRINSPGGSALASDVIWREAQLLKREKPLIVSMGDVAASGGYYIACMADTILAMPSTITGSIGVFGMFPNAEKMFDKLGMHFEYVKTSEYADFGRIDRPLNAKERELMLAFIEKVYKDFVDRVAEGRNMTFEMVDSIAQGRVWTGDMAIKNGLVDVHGGIMDAVKLAAGMAGSTEYRVKNYPESKSPFEDLMIGFSGAAIKEKFVKQELGEHYQLYRQMQQLEKRIGIQAIMPYTITTN